MINQVFVRDYIMSVAPGFKCMLNVGPDVCVCVCMCVYSPFLLFKDCVVFLYANTLVDHGNREHSSFYFAGL